MSPRIQRSARSRLVMLLDQIWLSSLLALLISLQRCEAGSPPKRNLLFIIDESARPDDFDMFGGIAGVTPSLKRFFSRPGSILVDQLHTDYPVCNPSRTAILLGRTPDTTGVKTNYLDWRTNPKAKLWQTLPRFLKDNGYYTMVGGKVFHGGTADNTAWSLVYDNSVDIDGGQCQTDKNAIKLSLGNGKTMPSIVGCKTKTGALPDLNLAFNAASRLAKFTTAKGNGTQPFALFIGFKVPHMPIRVNQQYFIPMKFVAPYVPPYEPARIAGEYPNETWSFDAPKHVSRSGGVDRSEVPIYVKSAGAFKDPGPLLAYRQNLRQLQLSGLHQTDSACGIILHAIDALGYTNNTLVIFVTDHGFGFGETRLWEKDIPMDVATRIPLLVNAPWLTAPPVHTGSDFFMNTVDIYRTIAGFLQLQGKVSNTVQGRDFSSYFSQLGGDSADPESPSTAAFSQVVRCRNPNMCKETLFNVDVIGYTVRTKEYRYIAYFNAVNGQVRDFSASNIIGAELYDHRSDDTTIYNPAGATYVGHEFHNLIGNTTFSGVATQMLSLIKTQFASMPKADTLPPEGR